MSLLTKHELDEQFEQFLKESVSDDSVDLGFGASKPGVLDTLGKAAAKPAKKPAVSAPLWWQEDNASAADPGTAAKNRFIKVKNHQAENTGEDEQWRKAQRAANEGSSYKPVPKPCSRALGRHAEVDSGPTTGADDSQTGAIIIRSSPSQPVSQRSPPHDSSHSASGERSLDYSSDSGSPDITRHGTYGRMFGKTLGKSQTIHEEDEVVDEAGVLTDSLEPEGPRQSLGLDTLEEREEKARFFALLEAGDSSAIDYSRLNRELDSTSSTPLRGAVRHDEDQMVGGDAADREKSSPAGSPLYSHDFEEEEEEYVDGRGSQAKKHGRSPMLAKVSLHDSLDSNGDIFLPREDSRRLPVGSLDKGQSYGQSAGSEMDALHEAYRKISHTAEASEDQCNQFNQHGSSSPERKEGSEGPGAPYFVATESSRGAHLPASTTESELPTAEELMRTIRPDQNRGFSLLPASWTGLEADQTFQVFPRDSTGASPERPVIPRPSGDTLGRARRWSPSPPPGAPAPHSPHTPPPTGGVKGEVERLMREQDAPHPLSSVPTDRRQKTPHGPITRPSPTALKKYAAAPVRGRRPDQTRPAGTSKLSGPTRPDQTRPAGTFKLSGPTRPDQIRPAGTYKLSGPTRPDQTRPAGTYKLSGPTRPDQTRPAGTYKLSGPTRPDQIRPAGTYKLSGPNRPSRASASARPDPPDGNRDPRCLPQTDQDAKASSELIASVQSFAAFLQHQIHAGSHPGNAKEDGGQWETGPMQRHPENIREVHEEEHEEKSSTIQMLRDQLAQKEQELLLREEELKQEHQETLNSLRKENYLLQSKLRSAEEAAHKARWGEATDPATQEKLLLLEKEMCEQEKLIQGYQQENEKLYLQMKAQKASSTINQEAMFTENQRLLNELASAKQQLSRTPQASVDHGHRVTLLQAQVDTLQKREATLEEQCVRLRQEKQVADVDLQLMRRERGQARAQLTSPSGDKSLEMHDLEEIHRQEVRVLEERHREEVCALQEKLRWFTENQELLDRDAARLRAATAETLQLKEQVEKLKMEVSTKGRQQQRARDAKKIQDLERQLKESEEIWRRRHPNSLPALIHAAASAPGATPPSQLTGLLERRIQRLEAELESCDEEAKRGLRAKEQEFLRVKLLYEQQVLALEQQLNQKQEQDQEEVLLQQEVQRLKDAHQSEEEALREQIQSLQQQLAQQPSGRALAQRSPSRHQRQAEEASGARIERLTQELAAKSRCAQELSRTVDRLQRERRTLLASPPHRRRPAGLGKAPAKAPPPVPPHPEEGKAFPPAKKKGAEEEEKTYQPAAFAGSHISEVLQENEELKERLARGEWERDALQKETESAQAEIQRLKQSCAGQLASLRAEHQGALEQLCARHALEHGSSKVAQLASKVATQEVMMQHLREQVNELQGTREALAVTKIREETLQSQVTRLLEELRQAQEAHSPELKHLLSLERQVGFMEQRHAQRERELHQVIGQTQQVGMQQQSEGDRWKQLAQAKSRELEAFRVELDTILDVLRELQRQGVVLPSPTHPVKSPPTLSS